MVLKFGKKRGLCFVLKGLEGQFFGWKCRKHDIVAGDRKQRKLSEGGVEKSSQEPQKQQTRWVSVII